MRELHAAGVVRVVPCPDAVAIIQDKFAQKEFFASAHVPLAPFRRLSDEASVAAAAAKFGFPLMLKARRFAYDGRGNAVARSAAELPAALAALGGLQGGDALYAEQWAPFVRELAVMVARSLDGAVVAYPVVETVQRDSICHTVVVPADLPTAVAAAASAVASAAVRALPGAGIFGVELFELADGSILLKEVAPRPHNSGHYTIEACATSQYEQLLRAALGWPLGDASLVVGAAVMQNILGEASGPLAEAAAHRIMGAALATPGAAVHWYGKEPKPSRKCGHVTVVAPDRSTATARLAAINAAAAAGDAAAAAGQDAASALEVTATAVAVQAVSLCFMCLISQLCRSLPAACATALRTAALFACAVLCRVRGLQWASSWAPTRIFQSWLRPPPCWRTSEWLARSPLCRRTARRTAWLSMLGEQQREA